MNTKKRLLFKVVAIILIVACFLPINALAVEPRASDFLSSYSAYVYRAGWGKIQVWFDVTGTGDMDEIGSLAIWIYESTDNENWDWVETFEYQDTDGMLGYNDYTHAGHVEYKGTIGRYYKAYVCIWGGKNGDGDTRYFWTNVEKATLFAE